MLSEIFQKPKPILGTVQLLPLPGSTSWNGRMEQVMGRAEQEATALASGGVDGLLLENSYDAPHRLDRIDTAAAIAMALIAKRMVQFTKI
ncbi:MAG: phosphorybosylanthranilate isomerase, partial [Cyanobacteria bacterium]|nr:phosphorybosylanthranilate isomerase [Cyanobacteriota bacterium]